MNFKYAITRKPGENFARGITTVDLGPPDYTLMVYQHARYIDILRSLGLEVVVLDTLEAYPDAYFVEDTAVVLPEVAIIANPGAMSRNGEQHAIEPVLSKYRIVKHIKPPGTLDGGDVLQVGKQVFVGISQRTNKKGAEQFGMIVSEYGYNWTPIMVESGLHLKSSVNFVGKNSLIITQDLADLEQFQTYMLIVPEESEAYAANTLWVNDTLIMPKGFPNTKRRLEYLGLPIIELDVSEARKMDGGLTCLSFRF